MNILTWVWTVELSLYGTYYYQYLIVVEQGSKKAVQLVL